MLGRRKERRARGKGKGKGAPTGFPITQRGHSRVVQVATTLVEYENSIRHQFA